MEPALDFFTGGSIAISGTNRDGGDVDYDTTIDTDTGSFDAVVEGLDTQITNLIHAWEGDHDRAGQLHALERLLESLPDDDPCYGPDGHLSDQVTWHAIVWQGVAGGRYWFLLHHPLPATDIPAAAAARLEELLHDRLRAEHNLSTRAREDVLAAELPALRLEDLYRRAGLPVPTYSGSTT